MAKQKGEAPAEAAKEAAPAPAKPASNARYYVREDDGIVEATAETEGAFGIDWDNEPHDDTIANRVGESPYAIARLRPR